MVIELTYKVADISIRNENLESVISGNEYNNDNWIISTNKSNY